MTEKISMLEVSRRKARLHDQVQRDAAAVAERVRTAPQPVTALPRRVRTEQAPEDVLAAMLVRDDKALVSVGEVRALFQHFAARLDEIDGDFIDEDA